MFESNQSGWKGGGIANSSVLISYDGTQIIGNKAGGGLGSSGGGVSNTGGTFKMYGGSISNNKVQGDAGGALQFGGQMTLSNVTLENNRAQQGGGIFVAGGGMTLTSVTIGGYVRAFGKNEQMAW